MKSSSHLRPLAWLLGFACCSTPLAVRAETAQYKVTFESTWSAATHPFEFPAGPHFSGLIGGTHNAQVSFWNAGSLASLGIQNMAEQGSKTALMQEVQTAISAGTADAVLSGGGISPSPGSVSLTFDVSDAFPLVTLVSMLAPSPDWFVGVSGLDLHPGGTWLQQVVVDLDVYDAGTDSGPSYASPNQATVPHVPIALNAVGPFAASSRVGTYTFERISTAGVSPGMRSPSASLVPLGPNPFRGSARFAVQVPGDRAGELAVYGVDGRRVRALFRGHTSGRSEVVTWDGRDDAGADVPSGLYFVALRVGGVALRSERVLVAR